MSDQKRARCWLTVASCLIECQRSKIKEPPRRAALVASVLLFTSGRVPGLERYEAHPLNSADQPATMLLNTPIAYGRLVVLPLALLPATGGWLRTGLPFGSPLRSTWLQTSISLLTVPSISVASLRNSDIPCGPSKSRRLSRIAASLLTGSPWFDTWFSLAVLPVTDSPFQCRLAPIFG